MCAKSKNVGLRLGLRLGMRLESWVYDWVCDWEPPDLSPLPESPRDFSLSPPLPPFRADAPPRVLLCSRSGRPSSIFAEAPEADAPPRFLQKLPRRTPLPGDMSVADSSRHTQVTFFRNRCLRKKRPPPFQAHWRKLPRTPKFNVVVAAGGRWGAAKKTPASARPCVASDVQH